MTFHMFSGLIQYKKLKLVSMSAIHEYHAISIFRKLLGADCEKCIIRGSRFHVPVTKTRNRAGWYETGEIKNMSVCYLDESNRPITEVMHREDDGIYNIEGWSHRYITFRGKRIYENPFPGMRANDDELAVADMLMRMKTYVETGEEFYSLRDGMQDVYLDVCMEKALTTGDVVVTEKQSWM